MSETPAHLHYAPKHSSHSESHTFHYDTLYSPQLFATELPMWFVLRWIFYELIKLAMAFINSLVSLHLLYKTIKCINCKEGESLTV